METEEKMENEKGAIKRFIKTYQKEIVLAGLTVGAVVMAGVLVKLRVKSIKDAITIVESAEELCEGYDIWALCNEVNPAVAEFVPKLKQFVEENGISIMCELI